MATEIEILEILKNQDVNGNYNIIPMIESFTFRDHKCITFNLLSMNLYELLKKNKFEGFRLTVSFILKNIFFEILFFLACSKICSFNSSMFTIIIFK